MKSRRHFSTAIIFILSCTWLFFFKPAAAQDSAGNAKITIGFGVKDSIKEVTAVLTQADTAVKGTEIHFYVKKSFGLLPLQGDFTTTDEHGQASVDFPNDLPGDASGNVTVLARVEDDDNLGNVATSGTVKWGVPLVTAPNVPQRALWSSANNAPWPLVFFISGMVALVWGIIVYILYQLVVIKRLGKAAQS